MARVGRSRVRFGREPANGRGRVVFVVLGILTVLVLVSIVSSPERRNREADQASLTYVDQVRPIVERSHEAGLAVAAMRENALTLKPDAVTRELTRIQNDSQAALTGVRGLEAPRGAEIAHDLLTGAMAGRLVGTKSLVQAMTKASDQSGAPAESVDALAKVGKDLIAADQSYQLFLDNLPPSTPEPPERSRWVPDESAWAMPVLTAFVTSLRNSTNAAPVHDVAVLLVSTDPPVVNKEGLISVVPAEKSVQVQSVIGDLGNRREDRLQLTLSIIPLGETAPSDIAREFVDLAPGQRRALTLSLDLPPAGTPFGLSVRVGPVRGDANPSNDEILTQFIVR